VWPFNVLLPPTCDLDACIEQVPEPTHTQALFSEPAVEALHMGVLDRLAGLDVAQVDLPLQGPGQEGTTGQLRAVVAADAKRPAAPCDDLIEFACHPTAGKAGIYFQSQALPCIGIDHTQHADRLSAATTSWAKSSAHSWLAAVAWLGGKPQRVQCLRFFRRRYRPASRYTW
jgi:hypothetical protein